MNSVVISGATGCIGIALIKECIKNNIRVLVLAHKGSQRNRFIPDSPLVRIEYCDLEDFKNFKIDDKYEVFYDFAWEGGIKRSDVNLQYKNIGYSLDAVNLAYNIGCSTFIGAGSQAEYGVSFEKLTAQTKTNPVSAFGAAKLCAGQLTRFYAHQMGIKHIWTRVLSVYGPNDGENTMIMSMIKKLLRGETPATTLGEQLWDYLYSDDAADAFKLIGEKGVDGKTYVIGSGVAKQLTEYIEIIKNVINPQAKINYGEVPYSSNQVMYLCGDISELTADTGWKPHTEFKEGIIKLKNEISIKHMFGGGNV